MLPDDVHTEFIEGIHRERGRLILAVRRAFARQGTDNLFENTALLVEHGEINR
jgi:hypothetical protein